MDRKGLLGIQAGQILTITGNFTNNSSTAQIGGLFVIGGTGTSVLSGTAGATFYNFTCTNAGKQINFATGNTYAVANVLTLKGAATNAGSTVVLRATGTANWNLNVAADQPHDIRFVDVQYSNAKGGGRVSAFNSLDSGFNTNWVFADMPGQTNAWTGATSTNWGIAGNWSLARLPAYLDIVSIPTNTFARYPTLDSTMIIAGLYLSNGAALRLAGYNLIIPGDATLAGSFIASGTETIKFGGNVDFTGGVFTQKSTLVVINGTNTQSITSAGNSFSSLTVTNTLAAVAFTDALGATNLLNYGGTVTFAGAVSASNLLNMSGTVKFSNSVNAVNILNSTGTGTFSGAVTVGIFTNTGDIAFGDNLTANEFNCPVGGRTLTFHANSDYNIRSLYLHGTNGNPLTLRSSSAGSQWRLNSSNMSVAIYVDVKDSDARGGLTVHPICSTNSGNNLNWDFTNAANWIVWNGSANTLFTNAANWTPSGSPSTGSLCLIDGPYTSAPTISSPTLVSQLAVGGPWPVFLTIASNALLTVGGDLMVLAGGTVTHTGNTSNELNKLNIAVGGNLNIWPGGAINADGKGYAASQGPGKNVSTVTAANYGGIGVANTAMPTYGSLTAPTNLGSGGDAAGGGAIRLTVAGMSGILGTISANGASTSYRTGAGGSVYITTGTIYGPGVISANGGIATITYVGGGGRIAVILTGSNADFAGFPGSMTAYSLNTSPGAAGTVYRETAAQVGGNGELIVDGGGYAQGANCETRITSNVTDTTVGTVILRNSAKFRIATNQWLTVCGSWSNGATFTADTNSTVSFDRTNTAAFYGISTFFNLRSVTRNKSLVFQAGKTNTVQGMLELNRVVLDSTVPGTQWGLNLATGGVQNVQRVSVRDSNASAGQRILAPNSTDRLNNTNWFITPLTGGTIFSIR